MISIHLCLGKCNSEGMREKGQIKIARQKCLYIYFLMIVVQLKLDVDKINDVNLIRRHTVGPLRPLYPSFFRSKSFFFSFRVMTVQNSSPTSVFARFFAIVKIFPIKSWGKAVNLMHYLKIPLWLWSYQMLMKPSRYHLGFPRISYVLLAH